MTMREAIIKLLARGGRRQAGDERLRDARRREEIGPAIQRRTLAHGVRPERARRKNIAALFEAGGRRASHAADDHLRISYRRLASSKQKPDEPDWTERLEIFAGQMEISNGFSELNDPEDQRRRFEGAIERTRARRRRSPPDGRRLHPRPVLRHAARGRRGRGVDRLCMLLTDSHTIRDVILFPLLRPEKTSTTTEDTGTEA